MTDLNALRAAYTAARTDREVKDQMASEARRAEYVSGGDLERALIAHVRPLFTIGQVLITRAMGEIRVVDISVPTYAKTEVRAVFVTRIKSGAWGKVRTTSAGVIWDFENNRWRTGVHYSSGRIVWDDEAGQAQPAATVA